MVSDNPELARAMIRGILYPKLRPDTVVAVRMWRDGHTEKQTVDGTVLRFGPAGCGCRFCNDGAPEVQL